MNKIKVWGGLVLPIVTCVLILLVYVSNIKLHKDIEVKLEGREVFIQDLKLLTARFDEDTNKVKNLNEQLSLTIQKLEPSIGRFVYGPRRQLAIRFQAKQISKEGIIIIGDSITDLFWMPEIGGIPVLNSGVSGSGVDWHLLNADETLILSEPKIAILAFGVNDTVTPIKQMEDYVSKWALLYERLVDNVREKVPYVMLSTILPVEQYKGLGEGFFNSKLIWEFNEEIKRISVDKGIPIIDSFQLFATPEGYMIPGGTVDGVHLTPKSYTKWREKLTEDVTKYILYIHTKE